MIDVIYSLDQVKLPGEASNRFLSCLKKTDVGSLGERLGYERSEVEVRVRPWVAIFFPFNSNTQ